MAQNISCCRSCDERRSGCHGQCERYKADKEAFEAKKSAIAAARRADATCESYLAKRVRFFRDAKWRKERNR